MFQRAPLNHGPCEGWMCAKIAEIERVRQRKISLREIPLMAVKPSH